MRAFIDPLVNGYTFAKGTVIATTGAGEDLLHVHAGLLIFFLAALILRKRLRSPIPLGLVVFFAVLNEIIDLLANGLRDSFEPFVDVANTVFWPTLLFLLARRWR